MNLLMLAFFVPTFLFHKAEEERTVNLIGLQHYHTEKEGEKEKKTFAAYFGTPYHSKEPFNPPLCIISYEEIHLLPGGESEPLNISSISLKIPCTRRKEINFISTPLDGIKFKKTNLFKFFDPKEPLEDKQKSWSKLDIRKKIKLLISKELHLLEDSNSFDMTFFNSMPSRFYVPIKSLSFMHLLENSPEKKTITSRLKYSDENKCTLSNTFYMCIPFVENKLVPKVIFFNLYEKIGRKVNGLGVFTETQIQQTNEVHEEMRYVLLSSKKTNYEQSFMYFKPSRIKVFAREGHLDQIYFDFYHLGFFFFFFYILLAYMLTYIFIFKDGHSE